MANNNICDRIVEFRIDVRVDSDHMPQSLTLEEETDMELKENDGRRPERR